MEKTDESKGERIAKVMARAGLCSRRDAEKWIEAGRVFVNGKKLTSPALAVLPTDKVEVDGQPLKAPEKTRLFLYHKPAGLVTTNRDEKGRRTIFDELPNEMGRVVTVGRLDLNTEGLLLLTNDGELSRYMELPATGWVRKYRVRVHGHVSLDQLARLKKGIKWKGVAYGPIEAHLEKSQGTNAWIEISLAEGKNREVRNVMEALGLEVNRLIRLSYGPFQLGQLPKGAVLEIRHQQLREQVKGFFK
jgi:23S rRNA pseudouridine2605 synthase